MKKHGQSTRVRAGLGRVVINAFILFHLLAIACVAMPASSFPLEICRELIGPYMLWSGLFQQWDMFAPDPTAV